MNAPLEPQLRVEQFAELRRRYGVHKMMELMDHRDWDVIFDEIRRLKNGLQMIANDDPCGKYGRWAREAMSGNDSITPMASHETSQIRRDRER